MSDPAPTPQDPAPEDAPDPAVLRAERRLRLLEELTEIGMELARALRPLATEGEGEAVDAAADPTPAKRRDPAEVFDRLSRAIRLTVALETKTDEALRDLKAGIVRVRADERAQAAERAEAAAEKARETIRDRVRDIVVHAIYAEADCRDHDLACDCVDEILDDDETYFDCAARPLREVVESLCKDLDLTPDWSRWNGEGWIDEAEPDGHRLSPYAVSIREFVPKAGPPPPLVQSPAQYPPPGMRYVPNLE